MFYLAAKGSAMAHVINMYLVSKWQEGMSMDHQVPVYQTGIKARAVNTKSNIGIEKY